MSIKISRTRKTTGLLACMLAKPVTSVMVTTVKSPNTQT